MTASGATNENEWDQVKESDLGSEWNKICSVQL